MSDTKLVLTGEFKGSAVQKWTNKGSGEKGETFVLVFEGDNPAYPEKVRVGKDSVARAQAGMPKVGAVGAVSVFAGKFGELWFKEWVTTSAAAA